jgi:hypothetical protein
MREMILPVPADWCGVTVPEALIYVAFDRKIALQKAEDRIGFTEFLAGMG